MNKDEWTPQDETDETQPENLSSPNSGEPSSSGQGTTSPNIDESDSQVSGDSNSYDITEEAPMPSEPTPSDALHATSGNYADSEQFRTGSYSYSYPSENANTNRPKGAKAKIGFGTLAAATGLATVIASIISAGVGYEVAKNTASNSQAPVIHQVTASPLSTASTSNAPSISQVLAKVEPAIVDINTTGYLSNSPSAGGFFGGGTSQFKAAGTGMIISSNGYVLTNNHVIANASSISVTLLSNNKSYHATVVGTSPSHDVALIKIQGVTNLPTVTLGNSSLMKVGDPVIAIGNALALQGSPTVTQGIISALGRTITAQSETGATETLHNLIQTDAPINPGNSGGPLLNSSGYVIGMNTAAAAGGTGSQASAQNIGFAEPINSVLSIVKQIEAHPNNNSSSATSSSHGFLGVGVQALTPSLASQLGFSSNTQGVLVDNVIANSPAMTAGLQSGDVIQGIDGHQITSISQLVSDISSKAPGASITVNWLDPSTGKNSATVTLEAAPTGA